jgi:hypothetical protein
MEDEIRIVPFGDFSVSKARMNGRILRFGKWNSHLLFHFPQNVRGELE